MDEEQIELCTKQKKFTINWKHFILSVAFIVSYVFLFVDLFNHNTYGVLSRNNTVILGGAYLIVSLVLLVLLFFVFKKNIWQNFEITSSKILTLIAFIISLGFLSVLLNYYRGGAKGIAFAVLASFSIFVLCYLLVKFVYKFATDFLNSLSCFEKKLFLAIIIFGLVFCSILFLITTIFTHPYLGYDSLFSFDTGNSVSRDYFLNINVAENDLRHILFTVASMPFAIVPYILSKIFFMIPGIYGLFISFVQVLLCAYVIVKLLKILKVENNIVKALFTVFILSTSTFLINMPTAEKFIFSIIYLFCTFSLTIEHSNLKWVFLALSVGILTTNLFFAPVVLFYEKKKFKEYIIDTLKFCLLFLLIVLMTGQLNLLIFVKHSADFVMTFSAKGGNIPFVTRFCQTLIFVANMYFIPQFILGGDNISQTGPINDSMFFVGIFIIFIYIFSLIFNRKDKLVWICAYVHVFMFILLAVIGWGSKLNEMFIYSAIFAWASFVLVFKLISSTIKNYKIQCIIIGVLIAGVLTYNLIYLIKILQFATVHYPVYF